MRARFFVFLFAFVVPIALSWMSPMAPVSTTALRSSARDPACGAGTANDGAAPAQH